MRKVNLPPEAWAYCLSRSSAVRLPGMSARKKAMASTGAVRPLSRLTVCGERLWRLPSVMSQRVLYRSDTALASTTTPSAISTSSAAAAPWRMPRRPRIEAPSRQLSAAEMTKSTAAAMTSAHWSRVIHEAKSASAPTASRHRTTPHIPQRLRNVMSRLASPPLRLERAERKEEREGSHRKVVDEIFRVDDALGESVHVLDDGRLLDGGAERPLRRVREPAEQPEREQRAERAEAGDDLVLGGGRHEESDGQEGRAEQHEAEVAGHDRAPYE